MCLFGHSLNKFEGQATAGAGAAPDQPSEAVARLTAWLGIRTLICRKKIHPFEKAPEFGFMASYADGRELIGE